MSDEGLTCSGCGEYVGSHIADRIEALIKELDEAVRAERQTYRDAVEVCETVNTLLVDGARLEARANRLEAAVAILEDALQEAGDDYPGSSMQQWCQQQVKAARAALKGNDHE